MTRRTLHLGAAAALVLLVDAGALRALEIAPGTRRQVREYFENLDGRSRSGDLSWIYRGAYGEDGRLPTGEQLEASLRRGGGGGAGRPPVVDGVPTPGPGGGGGGDGARPTAAQRFRESAIVRHGAGFFEFTGVLATYVGIQLLIEIDQGRMEPEDFWPELRRMTLSAEAVGGYFQFVGLYSVSQRILAAGPGWGSASPGLAKLHQGAQRMAAPASMRRLFLKNGILLTFVAGTIEIGHHWWRALKARPWEEGAPADLRLSEKGVVSSFLTALLDERTRWDTFGSLWTSFKHAVVSVDYVSLVVTSAAFVAGMALTSWAPGFIQLLAGFVLADLAERFIVPLIHGGLRRLKRRFAIREVRGVYHEIRGGSRGRTPSDLRAAAIEEELASVEESFGETLAKETEPLEGEFRTKTDALIAAQEGKLTNAVTTQISHDWIFRVPDHEQTRRIPGAIADLVEEAYRAADSFADRLELQAEQIVDAFESYERVLRPYSDAWKRVALEVERSSDEEFFDVVWDGIARLEKEIAAELPSDQPVRRRAGMRLVRRVGSVWFQVLDMRRTLLMERPKISEYERQAEDFMARAARTRAQELRARLARWKIGNLAHEARHIRLQDQEWEMPQGTLLIGDGIHEFRSPLLGFARREGLEPDPGFRKTRSDSAIRRDIRTVGKLVKELYDAERIAREGGLDPAEDADPAWYVRDFDLQKPKLDEALAGATAAAEDLQRSHDHYRRLLAETLELLGEVYAEARAEELPSDTAPEGRLPEVGSDEYEALRSWLLEGAGAEGAGSSEGAGGGLLGTGGGGGDRPSDAERLRRLLEEGGARGLARPPAHEVLRQPQDAYRPLLKWILAKERGAVPAALQAAARRPSPRFYSAHDAYRPPGEDAHAGADRDRVEPDDPYLRRRIPIVTHSTIRCHQPARQELPSISSEDLARALGVDHVYSPYEHQGEDWYRAAAPEWQDAWERFYLLHDLREKMERARRSYDRHQRNHDRLDRKLYPEDYASGRAAGRSG